MEVYYDGFCVIKANVEENYAIYADNLMGFFVMSITVAKFIARKLKENEKHGYHLLDLAKNRKGERL